MWFLGVEVEQDPLLKKSWIRSCNVHMNKKVNLALMYRKMGMRLLLLFTLI